MPAFVSGAVSAGHLRNRPQPTLSLDDLTLRPWGLADIGTVVAAYGDPEIQRWHVRSMSEAEARDWLTSWGERWNAETGVSWAVVRDGDVVGRTGFNGVDLAAGSAEAAYWTMPAARGGDVAARALRAASTWMLTQGGLHRLQLSHSVDNLASCRVAAKVRYLYEGTRRRHGLHRDGWHDMHLHALLAEDLA